MIPHTEQQTAFTLALVLSITAPSDEKFDMANGMAAHFAQGLTEGEIEACKAAALKEIENGGDGASLAASLEVVTLH